MSNSEMFENIAAYLFTTFIKSTPPYPSYILVLKKFQDVMKNGIKQLCNLRFPEWYWSQNCSVVSNTLKQGSTHIPTL
jgi:hypothetical protein